MILLTFRRDSPLLTRPIIVILALSILGACTRIDIFSKGSRENLPERLQGALVIAEDVEIPVANAKFAVTVNLNDGVSKPCTGTVELTFTQGSSLSPKGNLVCKFFLLIKVNIDLAEAIERYTGPKLKENMKDFPLFGYFVRSKNPSDSKAAPTFSPPIINQIGPLIQDPDAYLPYDGYVETVKVTYPDPKAKKGQVPDAITGETVTQKIEIENEKTSDANPRLILKSVVPEGFKGKEKFDKVIVWTKRITARSSDKTSLKLLRLNVFERYYYNYMPVRLPKFEIQTTLFDLAPALAINFAKNFEVHINFDLLEDWSEVPLTD